MSPLSVSGFLNQNFQEFRTKRLNLLSGNRASSESRYNGTHASSGSNCRETCNTGTNDEDLASGNFTSCRELICEESEVLLEEPPCNLQCLPSNYIAAVSAKLFSARSIHTFARRIPVLSIYGVSFTSRKRSPSLYERIYNLFILVRV